MKKGKIPVKISSINEEQSTLLATFSTPDVDRHGESVKQNWDVSNYLNNPVVLNSHTHNDACEVIGRVEWMVNTPDKLEGKIKFAVNENPKAKIIYDLYKGGYLNAFSVGFIQGEDTNELLELSAVSVPANARALAKAKGINVDELEENDIEVVDDEEETEETEEEVEKDNEEDDEEDTGEEDEIDEITIGGEKFIKESYLEEKLIKEIFTKEGRVLSKATKQKVQTAVDALNKLLEVDNKGLGEEKHTEEIKLKTALKKIHQEISETHEDNLSIKKKKLHKALRKLSGDK
jgi:hypothetical protein